MKKQLLTSLAKRIESLMPNGIPKYVRCYDSGEDSFDRYTVCFTGTAPVMRENGCTPHYPYLAMSSNPFYPLGFCQHGSTAEGPCDAINGWPPAIGRKNHLGKRIPFSELPKDCQSAVIQDYKDFWDLWNKKD